MTVLAAGEPILTDRAHVGHRSVSLRGADRTISMEVWYPASSVGASAAAYEVLPGVALQSVVATTSAPAGPVRHPLVLLSHGRTGTRVSYSQFCEGLAACGNVVVAPDHDGDTLAAWLSGRNLDDRANEVQRLTDARSIIDSFLHGHDDLPDEVVEAVDRRCVAIAGHSYGAYTAFAVAAGAHGVPAHPSVGAVIGLQPYLRSLSESALSRVGVASLLMVGGTDDVTPAATDADRGWQHVTGRPAWRLDLPRSGHQACSDIALYAELVEHVPELPQLVRDYLLATAAGSSGPGVPPWRDVLREQILTASAFLSSVFGAGAPGSDPLGEGSDSVLHRR